MSKPISSAAARLFVKIPNAKLWSPDSPHLYGLRVQVNNDVRPYHELGRRFLQLPIELAEHVEVAALESVA